VLRSRTPEKLSPSSTFPPDDTLAGALLGVADNNTNGKFTNQTYEAVDQTLDEGADVAAAVDALATRACG